MHRLLFGMFSATVFLLCAPSRIQAQSPTQTFTSADGSFSFIYPADWYITSIPGEEVALSDQASVQPGTADSIYLEVAFPKLFAEYQRSGLGNNPMAITQAVLVAWRDAAPISINWAGATNSSPIPTPPIFATKASIAATEMVMNGRPAARGTFYDVKFGTEIARLLLVLDVGDGYCVIIYATSMNGGSAMLSSYYPIIEAIAQSIRFNPTRYIPPTATADPFKVNAEKDVKWTTDEGTLTFTNGEGWYFVQTAQGHFIQNTPTRSGSNQPVAGTMRAEVGLPYYVRASYLWSQLTKKGFHSDSEGDQQILDKMDCRAVTPEITAAAVIDSLLPSPDQRIALIQSSGTRFEGPQNIRLGGKDAAVLYSSAPTADEAIVAVDMTRGDVVTLTAVTVNGELSQYETRLFELAGSFQYTRSSKCEPQ